MQPTDAIMEPYQRLLAAQRHVSPEERQQIEAKQEEAAKANRYRRRLPRVY